MPGADASELQPENQRLYIGIFGFDQAEVFVHEAACRSCLREEVLARWVPETYNRHSGVFYPAA
jgi:hypothetical protein